MQVIALAIILAAGPLCNKFCGTTQLESEYDKCKVALADSTLATNMVAERWEDSSKRAITCQKQLAQCESKPVCQIKKAALKKKALVVVAKPALVQAQGQAEGQHQQQSVVVNVNVGQAQAQAQAEAQVGPIFIASKRSWFLLGVRGAVGAAICTPTGIGLLGLRFNVLPIHLGLDVYTEFWHGTGAQLLIYPVQTLPFMWHVNIGVIGFSQKPFVTPDLPRQLDLTLGTGIEVRVLPFLWVTADLQARMANPVAIAALGRDFGTTLGKSLLQTQGMLGLMLRTW